jgi:hypothetical protein
MVSAEVQRTLVKSPPELWAELSDPNALARHLGELGDVRILRTQPETTVEWAAESISGTVSIKPSGWGTRVTLSVTRELDSITAGEPAVEEAVAVEIAVEEPAEHAPAAGVEEPTEHAPATVVEEPAAAEQPKSRRGLFARLLGRRRKDSQAPREPTNQVDAFAAVSQALAPETLATTHAFDLPPAAEPAPLEPPVDMSAELLAAEQVAVEQVTAVLTAALDRLGAAHHRPFSRA